MRRTWLVTFAVTVAVVFAGAVLFIAVRNNHAADMERARHDRALCIGQQQSRDELDRRNRGHRLTRSNLINLAKESRRIWRFADNQAALTRPLRQALKRAQRISLHIIRRERRVVYLDLGVAACVKRLKLKPHEWQTANGR
jgi:hypothetical protein